ncbi:PREDICTED: glycine-rich RNA-binding protein 8-like, partial [Bactrocera latifrons]|uniref:glycine-rich RNA-binding protein 8-like n=1 Tax=Bactrocera latifrons TaxID=174628 RepID=UPI0008DEA195
MRRYREIRCLKNDLRQKSNQVLNSFTDKSQKMSDWGDEDDGRGFGNGCSEYKDNGDDEYVDNGGTDYTELQNTEDGNKGFGSRRGRGGGRGRGGRDDRNGGSYGGGRRNFEDN